MRDFLHKINSNKVTKVLFCILIAIPIWLLIVFFGPKNNAENVPAEIIVSSDPAFVEPTIPEEPKKPNTVATQDETYVEGLDYKKVTNEEYLRVITVGKVDFTEKYITETIREQMFSEILETDMFANMSKDQITNLKIEKYEGNKNAFIETGMFKNTQYAAGYILEGNNLIYGAIFSDDSTSTNVSISNIKTFIRGSNAYIQQARAAQ